MVDSKNSKFQRNIEKLVQKRHLWMGRNTDNAIMKDPRNQTGKNGGERARNPSGNKSKIHCSVRPERQFKRTEVRREDEKPLRKQK